MTVSGSLAPTCYMCASPATSREHAPPQCLFPEPKDLPAGIDLRRNLITVPSCALHNVSASLDDEYLMVLLVSYYGTNQVAKNHFASKVVRALKRSPAFVNSTFRNAVKGTLSGKPSIAFQVDDSRFESVIGKTVRALHFNATGTKLLTRVLIQATAFRQFDPQIEHEVAELARIGRAALARVPVVGQNPDVFFYQLAVEGSGSGGVMRMMFYGGFEAFAMWGPSVDVAGAP